MKVDGDRLQALAKRLRLLALRCRGEALRQQGYERGYRTGLAVGYEEAVRKIDRLIKRGG